MPSLREVDTFILQLCCEEAIQTGQRDRRFDSQAVREAAESQGFEQEEISDSLQILRSRRYIEGMATVSGMVPEFSVTDHGVREYLRWSTSDYESLVRSVAHEVLKRERWTDEQIADHLGRPLVIVQQAFIDLQSRRFIQTVKVRGGPMRVQNISPELKRWLEDAEGR